MDGVVTLMRAAGISVFLMTRFCIQTVMRRPAPSPDYLSSQAGPGAAAFEVGV